MGCLCTHPLAVCLAAGEQGQRQVLVGDLPLELAAPQEELQLLSQKPVNEFKLARSDNALLKARAGGCPPLNLALIDFHGPC